ncbi:MAG: glycerate kinase, partial [Acidimicrobiales bacterium]
TGEGLLDDQSFKGKAVGGVVALARNVGVPVVIVAGDSGLEIDAVEFVTLIGAVGEHRAFSEPLASIHQLVVSLLRDRLP